MNDSKTVASLGSAWLEILTHCIGMFDDYKFSVTENITKYNLRGRVNLVMFEM